jgi:lipoate-protein ligase A
LPKIEYKVEGGKLIKVQLETSNGKISRIKITGDFFMHPEELIEKLEASLIGRKPDRNCLERTLTDFVKNNGIVLLGISTEDLIKCIMKACENFG